MTTPTPARGHTPGEWRTRPHLTSSCHDIETADGLPVAWTSGYKIDPATEAANAALIASAPDLLEACRRALSWLTSPGDLKPQDIESARGLLRAAIAKAAGA